MPYLIRGRLGMQSVHRRHGSGTGGCSPSVPNGSTLTSTSLHTYQPQPVGSTLTSTSLRTNQPQPVGSTLTSTSLHTNQPQPVGSTLTSTSLPERAAGSACDWMAVGLVYLSEGGRSKGDSVQRRLRSLDGLSLHLTDGAFTSTGASVYPHLYITWVLRPTLPWRSPP